MADIVENCHRTVMYILLGDTEKPFLEDWILIDANKLI